MKTLLLVDDAFGVANIALSFFTVSMVRKNARLRKLLLGLVRRVEAFARTEDVTPAMARDVVNSIYAELTADSLKNAYKNHDHDNN
jgi:hypothetical protein